MVEAGEVKKLVRLDEGANDGSDPKLSQCLGDLEYRIHVEPDLESLRFKGRCKIVFQAK